MAWSLSDLVRLLEQLIRPYGGVGDMPVESRASQ